MVHIVRSHDCPGQFLEKVILFIRTLGRGQKSDAVGPVLFFNLLETRSNRIEGFIPTGFMELPIFLDQRFRQPFTILDEFMEIPALDTEPSLADRISFAGQCTQLAAHPAPPGKVHNHTHNNHMSLILSYTPSPRSYPRVRHFILFLFIHIRQL